MPTPEYYRIPAFAVTRLPLFAVVCLLGLAGLAHADFDQASLAYERGEFSKAYEIAAPMAEQGSTLAQNLLGLLFENGQGVPRSSSEAVKWFEKSARGGNVMAQVNLARVLLQGRPAPAAAQHALNWLKKAAAKNYPPALTMLGMLYAEGKNAPGNPAKSEKYLLKAAHYGYAPAQIALGEVYLAAGGKQRLEKAYFWMTVALRDPAVDGDAKSAVEKHRAIAAQKLDPARLAAQNAKAANFQSGGWSAKEAAPKDKEPPNSPGKAAASTGTGFFVSRQGHVVTNSHVLADCKTIKTIYNGKQYKLALLKNDKPKDLALLRMRPAPPDAFKLRKDPAKPGEKVVVTGFPGDNAMKSKAKTTSGQVKEIAPSENAPGRFYITAQVRPGNSGGPLLDAAGNVIGVVVAMRDVEGAAIVTGERPSDLGHAINAQTLLQFLRAAHVPYATAKTYSSRPPADIARNARKLIVPVICLK